VEDVCIGVGAGEAIAGDVRKIHDFSQRAMGERMLPEDDEVRHRELLPHGRGLKPIDR